jgi:rsbT co-antagonist protein RsbR
MSTERLCDPRAQRIRERLSQVLAVLGVSEPASGDGDDLDQSLQCIDTLEAECVRIRAGEDHATERFAELSGMITSIVAFDYSKRVSLTDKGDIFDSFAAYLNMLVEELSSSTVSKAYVSNIIESMSALVLVVDEATRIKMVNATAASSCGYAQSELIGQPISALFPEVDMQVVIRDGNALHLETSCRTKGGAAFQVFLSASLMRNRKREVEGVVCIARDLTESKRAENEQDRMREAMRRQAILLEELSTPIIPISEDILVMPLVGSMDQDRARSMCETLLRDVVQRQARVVIMDITGVRVMDEPSIQGIVNAAQGLRLIGADVVLTGVQPGVAATLVGLDLGMHGIVTGGSLQNAIADTLRRLGGASPSHGRNAGHSGAGGRSRAPK